MRRLLLLLIFLFTASGYISAQDLFDSEGNRIDGYEGTRSHFVQEEDSVEEEEMPKGMYVWRVDERWGGYDKNRNRHYVLSVPECEPNRRYNREV